MGDIRLVVGLGNPGREYEGSRHNVGFSVLERYAAEAGANWQRRAKFDAAVAETTQAGRKIVLARPQTFMNASGRTCQALLQWHKISPAEMLVVVDDADLELGRLRLRLQGSSGGHNGLKSIIECAGTEEFPRLRFGIGRPKIAGRAENELIGFVLGKFHAQERELLDATIKQAAKAVACAIERGVPAAMNEFNS